MKAIRKLGNKIKDTVKDMKEKVLGQEDKNQFEEQKIQELDDLKKDKKKISNDKQSNQQLQKVKDAQKLVEQEEQNEEEDSQGEQDLLDFFPIEHIYKFDTSKLPNRVKEKIENFKTILQKNQINMSKLRKQCFNGIPEDCPGLRSIVWKVVLEYLPKHKGKWQQTMDENKETYNMLVNKFIYGVQSPSQEVWDQQEKDETDYFLSRTKDLELQHPEWKDFFKDRDQWVEIEKDTTRTRSEMHFFVTETGKKFDNPYKPPNQQVAEKHFDVLGRILFVYAKLNPGIKYVQGMNEILSIFYHIFNHDPAYQEYVESDCFFCFTIVMAEVKDCFIKSLDDSDSGIKARINNLNLLLKDIDPELWENLEQLRLNPHFYSLRWLMLIFTQEFEIFDVMRLWDSYLSHTHRQDFMDYICISILQIQRHHITDDFTEAMENLQRIQRLDIVQIVINADSLFNKYGPHKYK
ncbi:rab-GTPase-TBC domain protein (macronuclear) [Tetrahymena thermophila SB210]|uniref:Rab-GTPase-TBC domain protein n=1 Tax=Tetrahymena thermophila (strain SB210) TaxID=312017 RepID=Q22AB0_TETTS|nr:rab-GTPase-TBC domain protein [Tetrahymena thermophila SB210]EAR82239.2 rab-GTPase-TBC domain protein [Tetrahymena thermophila SB210]|eukprot:XP_001029902.2 rab-GTPase-TBC domain protein [Tetrahymena thermophila SB210]